MTPIAILLLCASAVTHAGWNLMGKRSRSTEAGYMTANLVGAVMLLPSVALFHPILSRLSLSVVFLLLATGFFQALYFFALSLAYRSGDMSLAYPLLRAVPIVLVSLITTILGRPLSHQAAVGFTLIVVGALLLPMKSFRTLSLRRYRGPTLGFALLAALGTTGYSLIDSHTLAILRTAGGTDPSAGVPIVYSSLEAVSTVAWLLLYLLISRHSRQSVVAAARAENLRGSILLGVGMYVTYTLVLVSMGQVSNVSYVVAFRQLSIPIGVTMGILLLREPAHLPKLVATALMVVGLLLTALA